VFRIVIDTSVLVAALRSRRGAAFRLLALVGSGAFDHCLSTPLLFEYEAIVKRPDLRIRMTRDAIERILDYLCSTAHRQRIHFLWRPFLRGPADDMVLELAVAGRCDAIVTYNLRDFEGIERFGIRAMTPQQVLARLRGKS
jgi:putative PIN family toxin of toxin-antitoxin system